MSSIVLEGKLEPNENSLNLSGVWRFMKDHLSFLNFSYKKNSIEISKELFNTVSFIPTLSSNIDDIQDSNPSTAVNKQFIDLPSVVHNVIGLYQGDFQIASTEGGTQNISEEFFIFAFYSKDTTINLADNDWFIQDYASLPSPPLFAMSAKKMFETTLLSSGSSVSSSDIQCFYGFGKNQFGIFSVVMMLNEKTNRFCLEKKYMLSKYPVGRRAKAVVPNALPALSFEPSTTKRRRIDTSKVRSIVTENHSSNYDAIDEVSYSIPAVNIPEVTSDDDKSYVEGLFDVDSFEIYEGDVYNGIRHGVGICLRPDGTLYEGNWVNGKETGPGGKLMFSDRKIIYRGDFLDGLFNGVGVYYFDNGDIYSGEWKESYRHGKGEYVFANGCRYVGEWRENKRHGRGSFYWPDGSAYEGEFEQDMRQGRGQLDLKNCFKYDGYWLSNYFEGRGVGSFAEGQEYHGSYKQGCREGRGSITFSEGAVYEGRFKDDRIEGMGTIKVNRTLTGGAEDETYLPINIQADIKRIHMRAGFGDEGR